eukprot:scaffold8165_cov116-Isochrysis_galbana.AAC.6
MPCLTRLQGRCTVRAFLRALVLAVAQIVLRVLCDSAICRVAERRGAEDEALLVRRIPAVVGDADHGVERDLDLGRAGAWLAHQVGVHQPQHCLVRDQQQRLVEGSSAGGDCCRGGSAHASSRVSRTAVRAGAKQRRCSACKLAGPTRWCRQVLPVVGVQAVSSRVESCQDVKVRLAARVAAGNGGELLDSPAGPKRAWRGCASRGWTGAASGGEPESGDKREKPQVERRKSKGYVHPTTAVHAARPPPSWPRPHLGVCLALVLAREDLVQVPVDAWGHLLPKRLGGRQPLAAPGTRRRRIGEAVAGGRSEAGGEAAAGDGAAGAVGADVAVGCLGCAVGLRGRRVVRLLAKAGQREDRVRDVPRGEDGALERRGPEPALAHDTLLHKDVGRYPLPQPARVLFPRWRERRVAANLSEDVVLGLAVPAEIDGVGRRVDDGEELGDAHA